MGKKKKNREIWLKEIFSIPRMNTNKIKVVQAHFIYQNKIFREILLFEKHNEIFREIFLFEKHNEIFREIFLFEKT